MIDNQPVYQQTTEANEDHKTVVRLTSNSKPVVQIEKIKLSKAEKEEIDGLMQGKVTPKKKIIDNKTGYSYELTSNKHFTYNIARKRYLQLFGGFCCICGNIPDYHVLYDVEGAKRIERYCQKDFDKWEEKIKC